jgi:hypothetical protein
MESTMTLTLSMFTERFQGNESTGPFTPNVVGYSRDQNIAAVLIKQSRGGDFALSEAALTYVVEAENAGRIAAGYIILQDASGRMLAHRKVADIFGKRSEMRRQEGKFGPYWWINNEFQDAMLIAEKAPF